MSLNGSDRLTFRLLFRSSQAKKDLKERLRTNLKIFIYHKNRIFPKVYFRLNLRPE
ncbi:hypothetical protein LEP1GSC161_3625 [Leptospira santarosai str. CBC1416]|uniref:Uncharacterized protein n=1 Tax=Leptospira santarosai str. CBC1416 TaxID=1193059 RepID=M6VHX9_9LEPT|nr:hypothetical protein LEP1GSC161_3625 [Leptospira santarosai str. CBC1416]